MTTDSDARAQARASTDHLAGLDWAGGRVNARVLDVSLTGARVVTTAPVAAGDEVVLTTVRMGGRPGRVVRRNGDEVGLLFNDELARRIGRQLYSDA
jgi:hypothetical protein